MTGSWVARFQLRCVLSQPLTVYPGAELHGELRLIAHKRQSYDIHLRLSVPSLAPGVPDHTVCSLHQHCQRADIVWCSVALPCFWLILNLLHTASALNLPCYFLYFVRESALMPGRVCDR